ncbi:O-antigen ligase family protein [Microbacterium sp. B24]|uniref:O-antigen ligase family protein n=1 Tax=Microbacterium sp. B24 TaxID=95616 RepID=UPI0011D28841|nr:hypothetical protein [Microbacterium sp. B24]
MSRAAGTTSKDKVSAAVRLAQILAIIACFSGFINLIPSPVAAATLVIDGITVIMLVAAVVIALSPRIRRPRRGEAWIACAVFAAGVALVLAFTGQEPLDSALNAVRNLLLYIGGGVFTAVAIHTRHDALRVVRTIMVSGLIIAAFGVFQFVFRSALPSWLLYSRDTRIFFYYGTDITRSTGLVGNSIVYGTFVTFIFILWLAATILRTDLTRRSRLLFAVATAISGVAVFVSFSRISIVVLVAVLAVTVVYGVVRRGPSRSLPLAFHLTLTLAIVALALLSVPSVMAAVQKSFIVEGLFGGNNASVGASTDDHAMFTQLALQSFGEHPWSGIGLGSQSGASDRVIITDGFHLSTLVEGGLFLVVPITALFLLAMIRLVVVWRHSTRADIWMPVGLLLFLASQVFGAGFYNTGFYGKVPNVVFWLAFGAAVAYSRAAAPARPRFIGTVAASQIGAIEETNSKAEPANTSGATIS